MFWIQDDCNIFLGALKQHTYNVNVQTKTLNFEIFAAS